MSVHRPRTDLVNVGNTLPSTRGSHVTAPTLPPRLGCARSRQQTGRTPLPVSARLNTVWNRAPVDLWIVLVIARVVTEFG